jgi:hypothetical protein
VRHSFLPLWSITVKGTTLESRGRTFTDAWTQWFLDLGLSVSRLWKLNFCSL